MGPASEHESSKRHHSSALATPTSDHRRNISPSDWPRWYLAAWIASALVLLVAFVWVRYSFGGPRPTRVFQDGIVAVAAIAAALALTRLARTTDTSMRRAWRLLAVGAWFEALGEITWTAILVFTGDVPYPGPPDLFYLLGYPLLAAGFVLFAADIRDTRPRLRLTLDGLVVATALLTLGWHFVLGPLLASSNLDSLETWISLAYPVLDIVVASIALVVAMNARGSHRLPLLLIAAGIFAWTVSDIAFAVFEFSGGYTYDQLGLLWLLGHLAIFLGAFHPGARVPVVPDQRQQYEFVELVFPFVPFLLAMGVVAVLGYTNALDPGDVVFASLVVVFLVARQAHISWDVTRLGRELETSERKLASRNEELLLVNRIVRHDIRNDMAVAHGWAGELQTLVDEGEESEMLDRVLRTTLHTIELTETLRDFIASLESGQEAAIEPTWLPLHLREPLDACRQIYPEATFTTGEIPDVTVHANALLGTVFRNLLNNAVQHNDTNDPRIDVAVRTGDHTVQIRIADNGPGVPADRREAAFGRGEKGLESKGSGVGLYLVRTLVDQYDGAVWIEENDPRGAVFVVELNLVE